MSPRATARTASAERALNLQNDHESESQKGADKAVWKQTRVSNFDKEQREMRGTNPMVVSERTQVRDRTTEVCDKAVRRWSAVKFDKEQREMREASTREESERTTVRERTTEARDKAVRRWSAVKAWILDN